MNLRLAQLFCRKQCLKDALIRVKIFIILTISTFLTYSEGWNTKQVRNSNGWGLFFFSVFQWLTNLIRFSKSLDHWKAKLLANLDSFIYRELL